MRTLSYRRRLRRRKITRKLYHAAHSWWRSPERPNGELDKGKIHCSCGLCQLKSTRQFGKSSNSVQLRKVSDVRKIMALDAKLADFSAGDTTEW